MNNRIINFLPSSEPPGRIYDAELREFEGLSLLFVTSKKSDKQAFCASSLELAIAGLRFEEAWGKCFARAPKIRVRINGGAVFDDRAIEDIVFFGLMIGIPGWNEYKRKATMMLTNESRGLITVPTDVDSPVIQSIKATLELAVQQERQARELHRHDQEIQRLHVKADNSQNQIEDLRDVVTYRKDRMATIAGLAWRGWLFDSADMRKKVGLEMKAIAKAKGDVPPKAPTGIHPENTHLPETFDRWERTDGEKYRADFYRRSRDKYRFP